MLSSNNTQPDRRAWVARTGWFGFTLIELLVVVALIALVASLAYPSYHHSVVKSRRQQAQTDLMSLQLAQEQYRLVNFRYAAAGELPLPANEFYTLSVTDSADNSYTLQAVAVDGSSQAADSGCTTLSLDHNGNRTPADGCWLR